MTLKEIIENLKDNDVIGENDLGIISEIGKKEPNDWTVEETKKVLSVWAKVNPTGY